MTAAVTTTVATEADIPTIAQVADIWAEVVATMEVVDSTRKKRRSTTPNTMRTTMVS